MMKKLYLAYGSNLNVEQMKRRCPGAKILGTAILPDYELLFKGSRTGSYLTVEKKRNSSVPLGVWEVDELCERSLDRYEGYPDFYYKKEIEIDVKRFSTGKVKREKAFIYIMHEDRNLGIPSRQYISTCIDGYFDFAFDLWPLECAYKKSIGGARK